MDMELTGPESTRSEHYEALIELLDKILLPDSGESMGTRFPCFLRKTNLENLLIFRAGNRPVSHAGFLETRVSYFGHPIRVGMVGSVATDPPYRGHGLATRLLLEVFKRCRRKGLPLLMISGRRGLYIRNGARRSGRFLRYLLGGKALDKAASADLKVQRCGAEAAPIFSSLYQRKALRFIRPLEEYELKMKAGHCGVRAAGFYLVRRRGTPVAYAVAPVIGDETEPCLLLDWGGEPKAALCGLARAAKESGYKAAEWIVHLHESHVAQALAEAGADLEDEVSMQGVLRIVDFPALMEALSGYLMEVIGRESASRLTFAEDGDGRFCFRMGGEELVVEGHGPLAEVLFAKGPAAASTRPKGELGAVLGRILPLPALRYDLTYA